MRAPARMLAAWVLVREPRGCRVPGHRLGALRIEAFSSEHQNPDDLMSEWALSTVSGARQATRNGVTLNH